MIKKELKNLNTYIYEEELECGLKIYVCPLDRNEAHARIVTNYGASIIEFKPEGKDEYINIPLGTAHFLEHKMFEQKDGIDIMDLFKKNGAGSNAYTSAFETVYYFNAPNKFFENLNILLRCVNEPYYTDENVQKEMGIIDQEIKAGMDNPGNVAYHTTIKNLFKKHPFRYPVPGTPDSIRPITKDILYDCYNTFYHPSNMYMVITGNVNAEETIKYIKDFYDKLNYKKKQKITKKEYDEPKEVSKNREIVNKEITNKLIENGYKICIKDINQTKEKINTYLNIYLEIMFGAASSFNKQCFDDKNILERVCYYKVNVDNYIMIDFDTEVIEENGIFKKIYENINKKEFDEATFDLIKKNMIKSLILSTDSVYSIAAFINTQIMQYGKINYDILKFLNSLNYEECKEIINQLDFSNSTSVIVQKS